MPGFECRGSPDGPRVLLITMLAMAMFASCRRCFRRARLAKQPCVISMNELYDSYTPADLANLLLNIPALKPMKSSEVTEKISAYLQEQLQTRSKMEVALDPLGNGRSSVAIWDVNPTHVTYDKNWIQTNAELNQVVSRFYGDRVVSHGGFYSKFLVKAGSLPKSIDVGTHSEAFTKHTFASPDTV